MILFCSNRFSMVNRLNWRGLFSNAPFLLGKIRLSLFVLPVMCDSLVLYVFFLPTVLFHFQISPSFPSCVPMSCPSFEAWKILPKMSLCHWKSSWSCTKIKTNGCLMDGRRSLSNWHIRLLVVTEPSAHFLIFLNIIAGYVRFMIAFGKCEKHRNARVTGIES